MSLKDFLKDRKLFLESYNKLIKIYINALTIISPVYTSKYLYKKIFRRNLDLKDPKTYNEKLMWLKLYWKDPIKSKCADKYEVREYVKEKGESKCLNILYNSYDTVDEIDWSTLPKSFVLKVNNTCGANIICDDKSKFNETDTIKKINYWMKEKFYLTAAEMHYKDIKPKIICEKYLKPKSGLLPIDYKIYCFNGKAKVIMLCTERESGSTKFYLCDLEGNILPFNKTGKIAIENGLKKIALPKSAYEMFRLSEKLSENIPFVRMDFYDNNGEVVFGEMTFTPCACLDSNISDEGEKIMGSWIKLPKSKMAI